MKPRDIRNIIFMVGYFLIWGLSIFLLTKNYIELTALTSEFDYFRREILNIENFFIIIYLFMIGLGLLYGSFQIKAYNIKRAILTIVITFFFNILAIIAVLKVKSLTDYDYTEYFMEFISYIALVLTFNTLSFLGSISGILYEYSND